MQHVPYYSVDSDYNYAIQAPGTTIVATIAGGDYSVYGEYYWSNGEVGSASGSGYCAGGDDADHTFLCTEGR